MMPRQMPIGRKIISPIQNMPQPDMHVERTNAYLFHAVSGPPSLGHTHQGRQQQQVSSEAVADTNDSGPKTKSCAKDVRRASTLVNCVGSIASFICKLLQPDGFHH